MFQAVQTQADGQSRRFLREVQIPSARSARLTLVLSFAFLWIGSYAILKWFPGAAPLFVPGRPIDPFVLQDNHVIVRCQCEGFLFFPPANLMLDFGISSSCHTTDL